jgi:dihydrofolate reductase
MFKNVGAVIMGRNMFGPIRGDWGTEEWEGWWGDDPPTTCPSSSSPITSVTRSRSNAARPSISSPTASSRPSSVPVKLPGGKDVMIAGGAGAIRQYLAAALLDEIDMHPVPVVLGAGERLFEGVGELNLEQLRAVEAPGVAYLKYRVVK